MNLNDVLDDADEHVRDELVNMPEVEDVESFDPSTDDVPIAARRWLRVTDTAVVVADLKGSTKLGLNKNARSTASIYEAALHPAVDIFHEFGAGWIPIQGDCVIGIFWGERAVEKAVCSGITIKTFSERHLVPRLETKWPEIPSTGFKIGVATSSLLVKRVGRPATSHQAFVWPGKAVNYAVKAAQTGDTGELIVTGSVWDMIESNDYLTFTCECDVPSPSLWHDHVIDRLDHDDAEQSGRSLSSSWCKSCGEEFCNSILDGKTKRESVDAYRHMRQASAFSSSLAQKHARKRRDRRNLMRARTGR